MRLAAVTVRSDPEICRARSSDGCEARANLNVRTVAMLISYSPRRSSSRQTTRWVSSDETEIMYARRLLVLTLQPSNLRDERAMVLFARISRVFMFPAARFDV